jgi:hypothetical protein
VLRVWFWVVSWFMRVSCSVVFLLFSLGGVGGGRGVR